MNATPPPVGGGISVDKREPVAHVSWPKDTKDHQIKLSGDHAALAMGKRAEVTLKGVVQGYSMSEYGCSIDLRIKAVHVESVVEDNGTEDMVEQVEKLKPKKTKKE